MASTLLKTLGSTYETMAQTCNEFASMINVAFIIEHVARESWIQKIQVPLQTVRKELEILLATSLSPMTSMAPSYLHHQYHVLSLPTHTYNSILIVQV